MSADDWVPPAWWQSLTQSATPSWDVFGLHLHGRPLMLAFVVAVLLLATAPFALLGHNRDIRSKWLTWVVIGLVVGPLMWAGPWGAVLLAAAVSLVCVAEYAHLLSLHRSDRNLLWVLGVLTALAAWTHPGWLGILPLLILLTPLVPLLDADTDTGSARAAYLAFAIVWLCWSPAHLVLIYHQAFLIALVVAVTDVCSWAGGKTLGRLPGLQAHFSPVSPHKTIGGLLGGALGAAAMLALLGSFSPALFVAIAFGAPLGDLVESLFKRSAKVKDAGDWLPGFGGLLDRVDSLLLVLPIAAALGV